MLRILSTIIVTAYTAFSVFCILDALIRLLSSCVELITGSVVGYTLHASFTKNGFVILCGYLGWLIYRHSDATQVLLNIVALHAPKTPLTKAPEFERNLS
ncbi:MAG: hypothetical protein HYZ62_00995 [Candidatus Andersenbacteria bacterium]|nr:hypothetical protein [Candidatus Andersenbacteria bacterium]